VEDLLPIGKFGRLAGLSIYTLRHYHDVGLLVPARVDDAGARWYARDQLERARRIRALRWTGLPVAGVARLIDEPAAEHDVLEAHRATLERRRSRDAASIADIDHFLKGEIMTEPPSAIRPVQIKLLVADMDAAAAFYADAFGFDWEPTQRTSEGDFNGFTFGRWDSPEFFLLHLQTSDYEGAVGPATFGLNVPDLDEAHRRSVAAGAAEKIAPHDSEGMPRSSLVQDPDGNMIWLYQA
jgi:DNA-binding transcriptional MerR regulator